MLHRTEQHIERPQLRGVPPRFADRPSRIANDAMKPLARMVARFCGTLARLPEHEVSSARSGACARTMAYGFVGRCCDLPPQSHRITARGARVRTDGNLIAVIGFQRCRYRLKADCNV